jgi:UDP-N-acetylglucosamine:LPS N-acetylglucosamine transferase
VLQETVARADVGVAALSSGRVHIVTGSFGAGHDAAAREIAARFQARGYDTRSWDIVDLFPAGLGRVVRAGYLRQLEVAPSSWGLLLSRLRPGSPGHRWACRGLRLTHRRLRAVAEGRPDVIISTHPFASQALGSLRAAGELSTPVVTYLTDMSVHPLWVHPAVDLHLAVHDVPASQARHWGGLTRTIRPVVPHPDGAGPARAPAPSRVASRRALGLPALGPLVLVTGGSLGIGELEQTARDVLATGLAQPVVLCGHNDRLCARMKGKQSVHVLGWRDDIPAVLAAVDCVVQNSGGFLSLEALAAPVPAVSYRCIPGHGETNAAALEEAGLIPWARDTAALHRLLETALTTTRESPVTGAPGAVVDVVDAVFPSRTRILA